MMTDRHREAPGSPRARVSVVVPFLGDRGAALALADRLGRLRLRPGDEVIVADNTPDGVFAEALDAGARVRSVAATAERSSYHARNVGAMAATGEWLLFIDADCVPPPTLIDDYLGAPVDPGTAVLAGGIRPAPGQRGLLPRWAATRAILSQTASVERDPPGAATANLMVRWSAWEAVGGFQEGIRSGGDYEFCWRVVDSGYRLESREDAVVDHLHREALRAIVRQMARYAAGNAWQQRRRPAAVERPRLLEPLGRAAAGFGVYLVTLRPRRAALKLVDGIAALAQAGGWFLSNGIQPDPGPPASGGERGLVVMTDRFPVLSETFITSEIRALGSLGWRVRVESLMRADRPAIGGTHGLPAHYLESTGTTTRLRALAWSVARHPLRSLADRRFARRFAAEERESLRAVATVARRLELGGERHVHAHFAARAAVTALRAGRIAGVPVSVAAHGHEVFATPRALPAKVSAAAFVAAPCDYTARHLREAAAGRGRVEVVVMGVDGTRFRRERPYPGRRGVAAVGRLVEKKGFADLIAAVGALDGTDAVEWVEIAGEGPLREELEAQIVAAGLEARVRILGAVGPDLVRSLLERADLLVMPCVVAPDGDRDAMPVVVKEALAMEVPVVGTDEVGLPEVIAPDWGRLVPPGSPQELAAALAELLALPAPKRAAMGRAGRNFVLERFDVISQARRLEELIEGARGPGP